MDASPTFVLSSCVGKAAFATPQLANKVRRKRAKSKRGKTYKRKQHVYHCRVCGHFHIGTEAKPRQTTTSGRPKRWAYDIGGDDSMD